mgnify:CR=1 FL=1
MNDNIFWEKYDKRKTWSTKSRMLSELFDSNEISTFNRLSKEVLENSSSRLMEEGIKVLKVLEQKFLADKEFANQEFYNKLLEKYKIQNLTNFWFKGFKLVDQSSIFEHLESQIQSKYEKNTNGKFKIQVKYKLGKHLEGYIFTNIGNREPFELSHFAYGFLTDLVDYNGKMLNRYPFTQIHKQQIPSIPYQILENANGRFKFHSELKNEVNNFNSFFKSHYEELARVAVKDLSTSDYIARTIFLTNDNTNLWTTLSIMNVAKMEGDFKKLNSLATIGKELLGNRNSGNDWGKYFNKYNE